MLCARNRSQVGIRLPTDACVSNQDPKGTTTARTREAGDTREVSDLLELDDDVILFFERRSLKAYEELCIETRPRPNIDPTDPDDIEVMGLPHFGRRGP